MTTTVKLTFELENALRQRCAKEGRSLSEVMRDALTAYLAREPQTPSAWRLGKDQFGLYQGPVNLAQNRKAELTDIWSGKRH
ncbi:Ribbon-helix-helix protein, CopG [Burkholderiaceae bacterium]